MRSYGEMDWLVQDIVKELRTWGHTRGSAGQIIMKCDSESSIKALRDAVGKLLRVRVVPETLPKGESQSHGRVGDSGKTINQMLYESAEGSGGGAGAREALEPGCDRAVDDQMGCRAAV